MKTFQIIELTEHMPDGFEVILVSFRVGITVDRTGLVVDSSDGSFEDAAMYKI